MNTSVDLSTMQGRYDRIAALKKAALKSISAKVHKPENAGVALVSGSPHDILALIEAWEAQHLDFKTRAMNDDAIRNEWRAAGGDIHGPNVETVTMPEADYFKFRRSLL